RHQVAVLGQRHAAVPLLPRHAGGYEDHLVELELGGHLRGGHEVAMVDGVEGATHHAKAPPALAFNPGLPEFGGGHRRFGRPEPKPMIQATTPTRANSTIAPMT